MPTIVGFFMEEEKSNHQPKREKDYTLTNLILLTTDKGKEIGEQFTMNLIGIPQQALNIPEDNKGQLFLTVVEICKKLSKLANAVDRYATEEDNVVNDSRHKVENSGERFAHHSDVLEGTVEEVLSQAKSTLDITVKIFDPLFGIKLHTFGDKGESVIKSLKNNVPESEKVKVEKVISVLEWFKPHAKPIIGLRTKSQHYRNIQMSPLIVEKDQKGDIEITLPKISEDLLVNEFVEVIYNNIFVFVRDLVIFSYASKFYDGLVPVVTEEIGDRVKKIGVTVSADAIT